MYIVEIHNGENSIPIHNSKEKLTSGKITKGINTIDSFQFTMLPSNIGFNEIYDYTTLVTVYNTNHNRYEFYGRVLYSEDTMSESGAITKEVICESYLGFLCDSQQEYVAEQNWTVLSLLTTVLKVHNRQLESYKKIELADITPSWISKNIYCGIQRENTWETLKKTLLDKLGGEIRFRVDGDKIYLDYLEKIGETSETAITLSRNMKSISREKDPSEIVTRLIPLGYKLTATDSEGKEVETEYRLDITSVNDGKNYIDDETAISIYGIRVATVLFDDVTVASTLLKKGEDWLIENNKIKVSYTATALDLSLIGLDVDSFEIYNYHPLKNPLLKINETVRIIKKTLDICEEVKSTIQFGDNFEKLSDAMRRQSDALKLMTSNYVTNLRLESVIEQTSTLIEQTEENIKLEVDAQYSDLEGRVAETEAQIELKISKDDTDQIISMINASADVINITSERLNIHDTKESAWGGTDEFSIHDGAIHMTHQNQYFKESLSIDSGFIDMAGFQDGKVIRETTIDSAAIGRWDEYNEDGIITLMNIGFRNDITTYHTLKYNFKTRELFIDPNL